MKTYIDHNTTLQLNELWIPKDPANRHYQQFLEEQKNGEAKLVPFVPPAPTWEQIRAQRDQLLVQSDWIGVQDATPKPNKEAWLTYRQALRDITKTYSSPEVVIWPAKPA
jgi:hypothetical protein